MTEILYEITYEGRQYSRVNTQVISTVTAVDAFKPWLYTHDNGELYVAHELIANQWPRASDLILFATLYGEAGLKEYIVRVSMCETKYHQSACSCVKWFLAQIGGVRAKS